MSSIKMPKAPEFVSCKFQEAWVGPCNKKTVNGWCDTHEKLVCVSCGKKATKSCDHAGSFVCGASLCDTCRHEYRGSKHVTKEVYDKVVAAVQEEEKARQLSRTSPAQRCDPQTGMPVNLFELLKRDYKAQGYELMDCYFLELDHGMMGFFPGIIRASADDERGRIIITTDRALLCQVWRVLPPRESKITSFIGYVHAEKGIVYVRKEHDYEQEEQGPRVILNPKEFAQLLEQKALFDWPWGLIGASTTPEAFLEKIKKAEQTQS